MKIARSISDWLVIFLFTTILLGSLLCWIFLPDAQFSKNEKRPLASFSGITATKNVVDFFKEFDVYYQDHFGLREQMIRRYQREVSKRFGESGMPHAVDGKDGWLFYAKDGVLEDLQGKMRFSDGEIKRLCSGLQAKHDWFAKQGILYIPLVAPNKQSVYGHKLQDSYRALQGDGTRFDQVLAACDSGLIHDLRPELMEQSTAERGYAKTDTHWNQKGALLAYYYLMDKVQLAFPDFLVRRQFTFAEKLFETKGGDLAVMLGRGELEQEFWPVPLFEIRVEKAEIAATIKQQLTLPQLQPELYMGNFAAKRLLVLHDSFYNFLKPYTSLNFSKSLYVWQFYDDESIKISAPSTLSPIVKAFRPDVVIEEIVERHLDMLLESVDYDWASAK